MNTLIFKIIIHFHNISYQMGPAALAAVPVAEIALGTVFGATLIGGTVIIVKNIIEIK